MVDLRVYMNWFFAALCVAIAWGAVYAMTGRLLETFSAYSILVFYSVCTLIVFVPLWIYRGAVQKDWYAFADATLRVQTTFILAGVLTVIASYLLYEAIAEKNATLASMVEITYPIFTIFFAFLLYKEVALTALGFMGVCIVFIGLYLVLIGSY